jgi:hypothetical protein
MPVLDLNLAKFLIAFKDRVRGIKHARFSSEMKKEWD